MGGSLTVGKGLLKTEERASLLGSTIPSVSTHDCNGHNIWDSHSTCRVECKTHNPFCIGEDDNTGYSTAYTDYIVVCNICSHHRNRNDYNRGNNSCPRRLANSSTGSWQQSSTLRTGQAKRVLGTYRTF
jgi:hypothetical protein